MTFLRIYWQNIKYLLWYFVNIICQCHILPFIWPIFDNFWFQFWGAGTSVPLWALRDARAATCLALRRRENNPCLYRSVEIKRTLLSFHKIKCIKKIRNYGINWQSLRAITDDKKLFIKAYNGTIPAEKIIIDPNTKKCRFFLKLIGI